MISHSLDEGCFGKIYECIDLKRSKNIYVIKVSENYQMLGREIQVLQDLTNYEKSTQFKYPYDYIPKCEAKGKFIKFDIYNIYVQACSSSTNKKKGKYKSNLHQIKIKIWWWLIRIIITCLQRKSMKVRSLCHSMLCKNMEGILIVILTSLI